MLEASQILTETFWPIYNAKGAFCFINIVILRTSGIKVHLVAEILTL